MKIRVTKEDIKNGCRGTTASCPVALAIKRTTQNYQWYVCPTWARNENDVRCSFVSLPESARRFIRRFDNKKRVKPFTFVLKINR